MSRAVRRLLKINVRVRDLDKALAVYCDVLGAELINNRGDDTIGDFTGATVRLGEVIFDLVAPTDPEGKLAQAVEKRGEGLDSIAFLVDDLDASLSALGEHGVRAVNPHEYHGSRLAFIHPKDTCGVLMELIQHSPEGQARIEGAG